MAKIELRYVGRMDFFGTVMPAWDTGRSITPVDMAEAMGFQTAIGNAPDRDTRRRAAKKLNEWVMGLAKRVGLAAPLEYADAIFAIGDNGKVFTNVPVVEEWDGNPRPPEAQSRAEAARGA